MASTLSSSLTLKTLFLLSFVDSFAQAGFFSRDEPKGDPEYYTKDFEIIPRGQTEQNSSGYAMSGKASTVKDARGTFDLELQLTIESPK